jgi:hypothetical protein
MISFKGIENVGLLTEKTIDEGLVGLTLLRGIHLWAIILMI